MTVSESIVELAPAKINLALHVRRRRADGYHDIETLFAFLTEGDVLHLAPADAPSLEIIGPFGSVLRAEDDNLISRAQAAFRATFGVEMAYAITLDKRLPIASGIGGGSADAAATLRGLARFNAIAFDDPRLVDCADRLGSDVPACLLGCSALGTGRGEQLIPLDGVAGMPVLLVNPGVAVSTAAVFKGWDGIDRGAIGGGSMLKQALAGRNDLEAPARAIAPEIDAALALLTEDGEPVLARMSGSGATCFALYRDTATRSAAAARIAVARPGWWCLESTLA